MITENTLLTFTVVSRHFCKVTVFVFYEDGCFSLSRNPIEKTNTAVFLSETSQVAAELTQNHQKKMCIIQFSIQVRKSPLRSQMMQYNVEIEVGIWPLCFIYVTYIKCYSMLNRDELMCILHVGYIMIYV